MKRVFTFFTCLFAFISMPSAQNVAGKINKTNNKINNTDTALNRTSDAINNSTATLSTASKAASNFGNTLGGILKKKPKQRAVKTANTPDTATQAKQVNNTKTITITIAGADYASVKKLKESLQAIAGVLSVDINYNSSGSSLSIAFNKKADDLWDGLADNIAAHYNIISMNVNAINVAYKQ